VVGFKKDTQILKKCVSFPAITNKKRRPKKAKYIKIINTLFIIYSMFNNLINFCKTKNYF